ncbi:MAG: L-threonylcarbamoyladenylate synthase [Hyphomonadaceae bacterium]
MSIVPAQADTIAQAGAILRAGGLVAVPTETVYGLAADAANAQAIARLYEAKGRPLFNPLIVHVRDADEAHAHGAMHARAKTLAEAFWPGPFTLVLPRRAESSVAELACAGLSTIALRVPAHAVAQGVLQALGRPFAAPSANRSGHVSPTTAQHVWEEFGDAIDFILDAGPCAVGVESSIVAVDADGRARLLRPGGVARERIEALIGPLEPAGGGVEAPGMLETHYAPRARLRLNAEAPREGEAYLGFGAFDFGALNLSSRGDLTEAAANLYAHLRALDADGADVIAVAPIPAEGLGEAIADRLKRAAAGR